MQSRNIKTKRKVSHLNVSHLKSKALREKKEGEREELSLKRSKSLILKLRKDSLAKKSKRFNKSKEVQKLK